MRYVILRDDDTNALTPVECLERLYRPFLARGFPVNLAVVPEVRTDAKTPDGSREGFLFAAQGDEPATVPIGHNAGLSAYLRANAGFRIVQHGCFHDAFEFDSHQRADLVRRLELGRTRLAEAGLRPPTAFVAPHDRFSSAAYLEVARRFRVISGGWYESKRIPPVWWPQYAWKKILRRPHWRVGAVRLLSHPGCILSYRRPAHEILPEIKRRIAAQKLTVLVTHWWEYFRDGRPDEAFIGVLHSVAEFLGSHPGVGVTSFEALDEVGRPSAGAAMPEAAPAID